MTQSVSGDSAIVPPGSANGWTRRLFVPVATFIIVVATAAWVDALLEIDLMTAAQNERLTFQTEGTSEVVGLTADEIASASTVLSRDRSISDEHSQVLYLGNSQTLAIMDRQAGDLTSPQWLQVLLGRGGSGAEVRLGALPNMSTAEMLLQLVASIETSPRSMCDAVVMSLVVEEFRGVGIRGEMLDLARRADLRDKLKELLRSNADLPAAHQALENVLSKDDVADAARPPDDRNAAGEKWIDRADHRLGELAGRMPYLAKRDEIVGSVFISYMSVRNRLLGITSSSARPVPEPTYRASAELLELILRYARQKNVPVLVYLAPIRPIEPNPNLPADVERFRREMPQICVKYDAMCLDFTDLVPEALWTNYPDTALAGGERDFAHFTGAAHKLVAETLLAKVEEIVARAKPEKGSVSAR